MGAKTCIPSIVYSILYSDLETALRIRIGGEDGKSRGKELWSLIHLTNGKHFTVYSEVFKTIQFDCLYFWKRQRVKMPDNYLITCDIDTLCDALEFIGYTFGDKASKNYVNLHQRKSDNLIEQFLKKDFSEHPLYRDYFEVITGKVKKKKFEEKYGKEGDLNIETFTGNTISEITTELSSFEIANGLKNLSALEAIDTSIHSTFISYSPEMADQFFSEMRADLEYLAANGQRQKFEQFKQKNLMLLNYVDQLFSNYGYTPPEKLLDKELSSFISYEFKKWEKQLLIEFLINPTTSEENRIRVMRIFAIKRVLTDIEIISLLLNERTYHVISDHFYLLISKYNNTPFLCICITDFIEKNSPRNIADLLCGYAFMDFNIVLSQLLKLSEFSYNCSYLGGLLINVLCAFLKVNIEACFTYDLIEEIKEAYTLFYKMYCEDTNYKATARIIALVRDSSEYIEEILYQQKMRLAGETYYYDRFVYSINSEIYDEHTSEIDSGDIHSEIRKALQKRPLTPVTRPSNMPKAVIVVFTEEDKRVISDLKREKLK